MVVGENGAVVVRWRHIDCFNNLHVCLISLCVCVFAQKVHDILRQAWDAEGSPFKGQPFDPSVVNVSPGGM